ncbi:MAG: hypothetical protein CMP91_12920 [Gammaproteobacteria bacterium]|nr:hypothetical protein [Gammaproteobacteria bacterium]|tara:strand:+ start:1640 stop:2032 length:393 start_codon:yes stop_codon:yes gene_type:complete
MDKVLVICKLALLIVIMVPPFSNAQDDGCRNSGIYIYLITPENNISASQDVLNQFFLSSGYLLQEDKFRFSERNCFVLIEESNKGYPIYLDSVDIRDREEIMSNIVMSLMEYIENAYPNPQDYHPVVASN